MTEVMIQEMEDDAAWLSTIHGVELMLFQRRLLQRTFFVAKLRRYTIQL